MEPSYTLAQKVGPTSMKSFARQLCNDTRIPGRLSVLPTHSQLFKPTPASFTHTNTPTITLNKLENCSSVPFFFFFFGGGGVNSDLNAGGQTSFSCLFTQIIKDLVWLPR